MVEKEKEFKLSKEEMFLNECIFVTMDSEARPITVPEISIKLKTNPEKIERALLLFEQEREAEREKKEGIDFWFLSRSGYATSWMLQELYLNGGDDSYQPKNLKKEDLTSEHIEILEFLEKTGYESPIELPFKIIQTHKSTENPQCLDYPLLADMINSHLVSHNKKTGFQKLFITRTGKIVLKQLRGYYLSWEELSEYQKEVLMILQTTTINNQLPHPKFCKEIEPNYQYSRKEFHQQLEDLEVAELMEWAEEWIYDVASAYITEKGLKLLKENI